MVAQFLTTDSFTTSLPSMTADREDLQHGRRVNKTDNPTKTEHASSTLSALNNSTSLANGTLRLSRGKQDLTFLLIGETGAGKTAFLSLIGNILAGRTHKEYSHIYDRKNAAGATELGPTVTSKLYVCKSKNGIAVRILDTPGGWSASDSSQTEHQQSIVKWIDGHIFAIDAVLVLVDGTATHVNISPNTLNTLSSIFPDIHHNNIGVVFTRMPDQNTCGLDKHLPFTLSSASRFFIENPFALRTSYIKTKRKSALSTTLEQSSDGLQTAEKAALNTLVELFNWLDGLVPRPRKDILTLLNRLQGIATVGQTKLGEIPGEANSDQSASTAAAGSIALENLSNSSSLSMGSSYLSGRNKQELTILLVCESDMEKSAFLLLVASVLAGQNPQPRVDLSGHIISGQTNATRVYEFRGYNNAVIRIVDISSSLEAEAGIVQDLHHKKSIAESIFLSVPSIHAVLILVNGATPTLHATTIRMIGLIAPILPRTLAGNIGVMFTNVASPVSWDFDDGNLPNILHDAPWFLMDNPITMQRRLECQTRDSIRSKIENEFQLHIQEGEKRAFRVFISFLDWVNGLVPQPTKGMRDLANHLQDIDAGIAEIFVRIQRVLEMRQELKTVSLYAEAKAKMNKFKPTPHGTASRQPFSQPERTKHEVEQKELLMHSLRRALDGLIQKVDEGFNHVSACATKITESSLSSNFVDLAKTSTELLKPNLRILMEVGVDPDIVQELARDLEVVEEKAGLPEAGSSGGQPPPATTLGPTSGEDIQNGLHPGHYSLPEPPAWPILHHIARSC